MFNPNCFSDEISDLQTEIDRRGFKWTAEWTSLSNLTNEQMRTLFQDNWVCEQCSDFPNFSGNPPQNGQRFWDTTEIKNQGPSCGSCWAFASVSSLETLALKTIDKDLKGFLDLSEQFMVDICDLSGCQDPGGCRGGDPCKAAKFLMGCGTPEEWCRPYEGREDKDCQEYSCISESFDYKPKNFILQNAYNVNQTINDLKAALEAGPIVVVTKWCEDAIKYYHYGIYQRVSTDDKCPGYHAMELIGYKDYDPEGTFGGGYFICKNSAGKNWGAKLNDSEDIVCQRRNWKNPDGGYFCIAYNQIDSVIGVDFGCQSILYNGVSAPIHYSISGNITSDNYSKEGINVNLKHYASHNNKWFQVRNVNPDSIGFYKFPYVLNWDYRVEPEKLNWCFNPQYQDIILDSHKQNIDFSVNYYNVFGSTKVAFLKPISGVEIKLLNTNLNKEYDPIYSDDYGNYSFSRILCGNYTISASKDNCQFIPSSYNFTLSYSDYNIPTFYCFLKVAGKLGPIFPSNSTVNVSGSATNGDQINQTTNVDSEGNFTFYLPEGSYTIKPSSECMVYNPPLLQQNVLYDENLNIFLNFTSSSWKICSSCYSTYFARELECSNLIGGDKDICLLNAKNEFKGCVTLKTNDANSYLYSAIVLSIQVHRAKGQPEEEIDYFTVEEEGDYFINITNGDNLNKDRAVSSAEINIEGIGEVFGPQDFNKNVFQLKKQLHLIPGEYKISSILRSKPDSYLTIVISNKDISSFPELP